VRLMKSNFRCGGKPADRRGLSARLRDEAPIVCGMQELQAIFDVIGTPEWACIDAVDNPAWRHYLARLPAQAPHLMRNFGFAGEPAVDFLRRMLAFDPSRRCSALEALAHEYLAGTLSRSVDTVKGPGGDASPMDCEDVLLPAGGSGASGGTSLEDSRAMRPTKTWLRLLDGAERFSGEGAEASCNPDDAESAGVSIFRLLQGRFCYSYAYMHTARAVCGHPDCLLLCSCFYTAQAPWKDWSA
jgi:hypothetical protein